MTQVAVPSGETSSAPNEVRSSKSAVRGLIKTIRPHQWVKNVFVLAPIVFRKNILATTPSGDTTLNLTVTGRALAATVVFCLLAGAIYTINDLADVEADRIHPVKRARPIASGQVPERLAKAMAAGLVLVSMGMAFLLDWRVGVVGAVYFVKDIAYTFKLKQVAFLDVALIASGFVLRVLAGGFATEVHVSEYMIACTALLALFLGFGKRRHELELDTAVKQRPALESYSKASLNGALWLTGLATTFTYVAYTLDATTREFFHTGWLWLTAPFEMFGILRFLMLVSGRAGRGLRSESPTQEMLRDVPFMVNLVLWVVVVIAIIYRLRPA